LLRATKVTTDDTIAAARERILACPDLDSLKAVERDFVGKKGVVANFPALLAAH